MRFSRLPVSGSLSAIWAAIIVAAAFAVAPARAQPLLPGSGIRLSQVGDDFEDSRWEYLSHPPKSSRDVDGAERLPAGEAANGRWYEGVKRGHPDIVQRVPTPAGGLPGSNGSLLLQSLYTGIPGRPGYRLAQDDLIADVNYRWGGPIPAAHSPSVVVRLFLPPVARWEPRSGPHFGFRIAVEAAPAGGGSAGAPPRTAYWPGMFIDFQSKADGQPYDSARFLLRADRVGRDLPSRQIGVTGWWTLGLSVSPDGMVHYYARPGVEPLSSDDRLASDYPYGYRAEAVRTFFFNLCSGDDGRSWSTPWIVDDPAVYVVE